MLSYSHCRCIRSSLPVPLFHTRHISDGTPYNIHTCSHMKLVQKMWKCTLEMKFGSSSTSGKNVQNVSIHYPGYTQKYKCKVCPSAVGTMSIFAIHHAPGPGNMHAHSKDTSYRLMPLVLPQLFHFVLVQPFCLLYFLLLLFWLL